MTTFTGLASVVDTEERDAADLLFNIAQFRAIKEVRTVTVTTVYCIFVAWILMA